MTFGPGRPPKPQEDHELHGTLRRDRHGDDTIAFRPEGYAEKPKDLGEHGAWLWDFIIGDLHRERVACRIDTVKLAAACEWYDRYRRWGAALDALDVHDKQAGGLTNRVAMAWNKFDSLASEFGLSPVARMRMRMTKKDEKPKGVWSRKRA